MSISSTSFADETPPQPMTGQSTFSASLYTHRTATGKTALPESPP